jgi:KipI family sensor histidine kinase inhibitor
MKTDIPCINQLTENALLFTVTQTQDLPAQQRIWQLVRQLRELPEAALALQEIVPGMGNLMIVCKAEMSSELPAFADLLQTLWSQSESIACAGRQLEIPTWYGGSDGPDLAEVAAHTDLTETDIIEIHSGAQYQVYCLGFQPGFAYLGGMDMRLATPRKTTPRLSTPAGSVGIGGSQTGIYPAISPGGWQIIGRTDLSLFDIDKSPPCLLQPGDTIRFLPQ